MSYPMMHVMLPNSSTPVDRHGCENITVPRLLMRVINMEPLNMK